MPITEHGCEGPNGIDTIFVDNVYGHTGADAWKYTAAISGAHTLGETK